MANNDLTAPRSSGLRAWAAKGRQKAGGLALGKSIDEAVRCLSAKWCTDGLSAWREEAAGGYEAGGKMLVPSLLDH